ncbi:NAD kinase [Janthinobacterium sp. CG_23.3]|uniref:sugar kinase n=1 Tax=Janthinobacterium sp. CG_23.3 TaxID=3349634 RepID=UPI0038D4F858
MRRHTENKTILVTRKTRLENLVAQYNTVGQAKFYIEHLGADFSDYLVEHDTYQRCVREAETTLQQLSRVQVVERAFLPNFLFGPQDVVVALGQDGLVANTLKYLDGQPLIGVNPDPKRWDGVLLPFGVADLAGIVAQVFAGRRQIQEVTMAKVALNNGQTLYGVNDIFIGPKSHTSARYTICLDEAREQQSSSGVIVSTGLGSTGWLKSLLAGASAIAAQATPGGAARAPAPPAPWDADYLYFTVREPFPSRTSAASLVFGKISAGSCLTLTSQMAENGVIFSDGIEADYLEFNSGIVARLGPAEKKGLLVV